jgi:imidazoleglycerol-phosphate dehydratase
MRNATVNRKTAETDIELCLEIDGKGKGDISTGCGFLDHMLTLFARHGGFDLSIKCAGDTYVDYHHSAEDIGICLGKALSQAMGDMTGIKRYSSLMLPMDEALVLCAADISGRGFLSFGADFKTEKIGDFDTQLVEEFFRALALNAGITLHVRELYGENSHHIAEAMFKAAARALRAALETDDRFADSVPSTKGVL